MELRHLRYFIAVAEELHFGRAAERLHVAQPPLSQQIRALEDELGVQLFRRTSRRVELTGEGRLFLDHARLVMMHAQRATEAAKAASRGEAGRISIGFVTSSVYSLVPTIMREFHRLRPQVELNCFELKPLKQTVALLNREIDVGFLRMPVREPGLQSALLNEEPLVLAVPSDHPKASDQPVNLGDFATEPFIMLPRALAQVFYDTQLSACRQAGFTPRHGQETGEWQTALALVAAGLGVTLVPESLRHWQRPGVVYCGLKGTRARVELHVAWRVEKATPLVETFVAIAQEIASTAADGKAAAAAARRAGETKPDGAAEG